MDVSVIYCGIINNPKLRSLTVVYLLVILQLGWAQLEWSRRVTHELQSSGSCPGPDGSRCLVVRCSCGLGALASPVRRVQAAFMMAAVFPESRPLSASAHQASACITCAHSPIGQSKSHGPAQYHWEQGLGQGADTER